jgi:hypothetical protein
MSDKKISLQNFSKGVVGDGGLPQYLFPVPIRLLEPKP